jgi:Zn-finger nucleic acid-binding protein
MFEGAIYCPACGTRRARSAGGDRQAPCPACRGVMREVLVGETALLECGKCRGMWLDAATFEHVCADREAQGAVLHQWPSTRRPATPVQVRYRKCVACGKMMNRLNFGRLSGTVVDVCKGHGTFLDEGELHLIVTFIQQGGLDRARQRQIEDLRDEEARLRAAQSARQPAFVESTVETTSWSGRDLLSLLEHLTRR